MRQHADVPDRKSRPPPQPESTVVEPSLQALVVDPHDDSRELMAEMLRQAGCRRVTLACDAAMARWHLRAASHDLVVTEVHLPDASDFELIDRAHAEGLLSKATAVIFCSTSRWVREAIRARGAQALFKPLDFDQVVQTVRRLVRTV
jgi:DNA-binding NtrC family response regulator